jgi:hypothetical protein
MDPRDLTVSVPRFWWGATGMPGSAHEPVLAAALGSRARPPQQPLGPTTCAPASTLWSREEFVGWEWCDLEDEVYDGVLYGEEPEDDDPCRVSAAAEAASKSGGAVDGGYIVEERSDGECRGDTLMPTYIDCHLLAAIPSAGRQQMQREALCGIVDAHGVQPLAHWVTDGVIYCIVQAPDQGAVCQHHAERGLACDHLHPIAGLRGSHPLSTEETEIVRSVLADLWPPMGCVAA